GRGFGAGRGGGLGSVALAQLLGAAGLLGAAPPIASPAGPQPGRQQLPHHAPRARRVIQLFMNGGASQMDLFDHKPELTRLAGTAFDPRGGQRAEAATSETGKAPGPPFPLRPPLPCRPWVRPPLPPLAYRL